MIQIVPDIRKIKVKQFQQIKGVSLATVTSVTGAMLDNLIADGVNFVWLVIAATASTATTSTITAPSMTVPQLQTAYNLAKSKGLKVGFKFHCQWNGSGANYIPTDVPTFFTNYQTMFLSYLAAGSNWDLVNISNELESLTISANLASWTSFISAVKSAAPGVLLVNCNTYTELLTNSFLSQMDYVGCNFYPKVTLSTSYTADDLITGIFRTLDDWTPVDLFNSLAQQYSKPVLITEVGVVPCSDAMSNPALDTFSIYNTTAQALFYQAIFETLGKMENVIGMAWWEATQVAGQNSHNFVGNPAEAIVQANWK